MKIPGIADKAFIKFPNSLIEFSVSVVSIAPLDSVTLAPVSYTHLTLPTS